MAPPSAADKNPSMDRDLWWLQSLSEPELDLVMSLKELAVTQAAAHPDLSSPGRFHLRTLRALGIVLLEHFKDRLQQAPAARIHRLALLRDSELHSMSNGDVDKKPRQLLQHGSSTPSSKRRKMESSYFKGKENGERSREG